LLAKYAKILAVFNELKLLAKVLVYGKVQDAEIVKIKVDILWKKEETMSE